MSEHTESQTSASLLERLRCGNDEQDWRDFCRKYDGLIQQWCRAQGLAGADVDEAVQQVRVRLMSKLRTFHYDRQRGTFRGWLRKTTGFAVRTVRRENSRRDRGSGSPDVADQLARVPDVRHLEDLLLERLVIEEGETHVLADANEWHVQAYQLAKQGLTRDEIGAQLNQTANAVNVALHRIMRKLRLWLSDKQDD